MKPFFSVITYTILIAFALSTSLDNLNDINEMKQLIEKAFDKTLEKLNNDGLLKKLQETENSQIIGQNQKLITGSKNDHIVDSVDSYRKLPLTVRHHKRKIVSMQHGKIHVHNANMVGEHHSHHHQEVHTVAHVQSANNLIGFKEANKPLIAFDHHQENDQSLPGQLTNLQVPPENSNCPNALGEPKDKNVSLKTKYSTHKLIKKHDKETVERSNNYKSVSHKTHIDTFYQNEKIESKDHKHTTKHIIGVDEYNVPYKEDIQENSMHKSSHIFNHDKNDPSKDEEIITMSNMVQEFTKDDSFMPVTNGNENLVDFLNGGSNGYSSNIPIPLASVASTHNVNTKDHNNNMSNIMIHHDSDSNNIGNINPAFFTHNIEPQVNNQQLDQLLDHLQDDGDESGMFDMQGHKTDSNDDNGDNLPMEFFHYKNMNRQHPSFLPAVHKEINGSPFPQQFQGLLAGLLGPLGNTRHQNGFSLGSVLGPQFPNRTNPHLAIPSLQDHEAQPYQSVNYKPINNAAALEKKLPSDMSNIFALIGDLSKKNQGLPINNSSPQEIIQQPREDDNLNERDAIINEKTQPQTADLLDSSDSDEEVPINVLNQITTQTPSELKTEKTPSQDSSNSSDDIEELQPNDGSKDTSQSVINQTIPDNNELKTLKELLKEHEQRNPQLIDPTQSNAQLMDDPPYITLPKRDAYYSKSEPDGESQDLGQFNEGQDVSTNGSEEQSNGIQGIVPPQGANIHNINVNIIGPNSDEKEDLTDNNQIYTPVQYEDEEYIKNPQMSRGHSNSLRGLL